jgi:translin
MDPLDQIGERILAYLEQKNAARDLALQRSRTMIRHCALSIRAAHRQERPLAREHLDQAETLGKSLRADLQPYPDLYHAGYTQDAFREYVEASVVLALLGGEPIPDPQGLEVEYAAYLAGLGDAVGELRRRVLDILRHDHTQEAERLLDQMEEIYALLITVDFPDAITGGLRRVADQVRGMLERTRGDLTTSAQGQQLKAALERVERKLDRS